MKKQVIFVSAIATLVVTATAAETDFYERFTTASKIQSGFLRDGSLVQTNNAGPVLTNAAISWSKFAHQGELAGIKLGMTMAEVVAQWGKPHQLFTHCGIGPRFWYGTGPHFGDLTLSFRSNILVRIVITGQQARRVNFDNGLAGRMSRIECQKLLGAPTLRDPDPREGLYIGEIAYRVGNLRTDIGFRQVSLQGSPSQAEHLGSIAVCLESEAVRQIRDEK